MERFSVDVREDHLQRLARSPIDGIVELIWNALDADADHIRVELVHSPADGIDAVRVTDDGHGMSFEEARTEFKSLGGSWKQGATATRAKNRTLHGSEGKGRWAAFGVPGSQVVWDSVAETPEGRQRIRIQIDRATRAQVSLAEPAATTGPLGTTVTVSGISEEPAGLRGPDTWLKLTAVMAIHLMKYPQIQVTFDGRSLRPETLHAAHREYELAAGSEHGPATLSVVEWQREFPRMLYLCTSGGAVLNEVRPGIQAPGFDFTAYVRWAGFEAMSDRLDLAEFDQTDLAPVIDEARAKLREHFGHRDRERAALFIDEWKAEQVYPYPDAPLDAVTDAKRQIFDIVAVQAAQTVNSGDRGSRNLSLRLLKEAIDSGPVSLQRVLQEVLDLPKAQLDELNEMLDRTSLASVISAAKLVADRTTFLAALETLVFDEDVAGDINERDHLHKILRGETWIFGDRFSLVVDEGSLNRVLEKHLELLERPQLSGSPVVDEEGKMRRVDLMLAGSTGRPSRREHLVVELKRPGLVITDRELTQVEKYALTVAADERFDKVDVRWEFVLVSNRLNDFAEAKSNLAHLPPGVTYQRPDGNVRVVVRTWGEIVDECKERLKFVADKLDYLATSDDGLDYLRRLHAAAIPPVLRTITQVESEDEMAAS